MTADLFMDIVVTAIGVITVLAACVCAISIWTTRRVRRIAPPVMKERWQEPDGRFWPKERW